MQIYRDRRGEVRRAVRAGVLTLVWTASVACGSPVRERAQAVLARTMPPGQARAALNGPEWAGQSARFSWEFATRQASDAYILDLASRLTGYSRSAEDPSRVVFTRYENGDLYRLELSFRADGSRTMVRCLFLASPD